LAWLRRCRRRHRILDFQHLDFPEHGRLFRNDGVGVDEVAILAAGEQHGHEDHGQGHQHDRTDDALFEGVFVHEAG